MESELVITRVRDFVEKNLRLTNELGEMKREMASFHTKNSIFKAAGTTIGAIGAVSGAAIFFMATAPVSAPIALGAAMFGTATNIVASEENKKKTKRCKRNIERALEDFEEDLRGIKVVFQYLAENVFTVMNELKVSFDAAVVVFLATENNLGKIRSEMQQPIPADFIQMAENTKYGFILVFAALFAEEKDVIALCHDILKKFEWGLSFCPVPSNLTTPICKTITVVNLVLTLFEIASVRRELNYHPSCELIEDIIRKLEKVNIETSKIVDVMEQARNIEGARAAQRLGCQPINAAVFCAYAEQWNWFWF